MPPSLERLQITSSLVVAIRPAKEGIIASSWRISNDGPTLRRREASVASDGRDARPRNIVSFIFLARWPFSRIVPNLEARSLPQLDFEFLPSLDLMILYQTERTPTDAEWDTYLAAIKGPSKANLLRCLVITEGGHPTQAQRERMTRIVDSKRTRVAVISPAATVRFVVSVLALVNRDIKAFSPKEYHAACSHIGLARVEHETVEVVVGRLRQKLMSKLPVSLPPP
jgi:hypothetical protein